MTNKEFLAAAERRLNAASYCPRKLIFIHAGAAALVTFLGSLLSYLLTNSMDAATGLAGLDTRTGLSFFRTILLFVTTVAMPFWELGYTRAAVLYAREKTPTPSDLFCGFRRFFPALRMMLLQAMVIFAVLFLTVQLATVLFMLSPLSLRFLQQAENVITPEAMMDPQLMEKLMPSLIPVYILWAALALTALLFLFYRFRFASFALMDQATGAREAYRLSFFQTKHRCKQLFKLDLRFWWYYALGLLTVAVSYLDMLLPKLGIAVNQDLAFWVFFLLGQISTLALHLFCTPKVQTTYALFAQGSFQP